MPSEQLGIGVMIGMLSGNRESAAAVQEAIGRKIVQVKLEDNSLTLTFDPSLAIELYDDGQSCCESRYMRTDDDPSDIVGHVLMSIETAPAPSIGSDEDHDVEFLRIITNRGLLVISNHNEHNGYYGGFCLRARKLGAEESND